MGRKEHSGTDSGTADNNNFQQNDAVATNFTVSRNRNGTLPQPAVLDGGAHYDALWWLFLGTR